MVSDDFDFSLESFSLHLLSTVHGRWYRVENPSSLATNQPTNQFTIDQHENPYFLHHYDDIDETISEQTGELKRFVDYL